MKKDMTSNVYLLYGSQQILSSPPQFNLIEYKRLKKEVTISISQSYTDLMKEIFHLPVSFKNGKWSPTKASLKWAILNNTGKDRK